MKNNKNTAYFLYIGSMIVFGTVGIFRRFIPIPSAPLSCLRGLLGGLFLFSLLLIIRKGSFEKIGIENTMLLVINGALIAFNWVLLFESYNYTSVATATLCLYMQPTMLVLLSPLLFSEKLTQKKLLCALISVVGMVFVSGILSAGKIGFNDIKGILCGLSAAILYTFIIFLGKTVKVDNAYLKTFIQVISAGAVVLPYIMLTGEINDISFSPASLIMTLILGFVHTGIAYAMYFGSMNYLSVQSIAVLSYLDPVSALIFSALILKENMSLLGVVGAVMIIGSAIISEVDFKKKKI